MLILKSLHFTGSAAMACIFLYQSYLYFEYFHLTKDQVGLLGSIAPVVSLFSIPRLMYIAERSLMFNMKNMMIVCVFLGSLVWSGQLLVQRDTQYTLILLSTIALISACTIGCMGSFLDAITLRVLQDPKEYGKQRLYGSLSWGLSSLITGIMIDQFHDIWWSVYIYFGWITLFLAISFFIDYKIRSVEESVYEPINDEELDHSCLVPSDEIEHRESTDDNHSNEEETCLIKVDEAHQDDNNPDVENIPSTANETLFQAVFKTKIILFFAVTSLLGLVFSVIGSYLFIYLATTWQASPTFLGMTTPFSVFWELPLFFFSDLLLKKIGTTKMLVMAHLLMLLRLLIYMFLPSVVPVSYGYCMLFVESLHGAIFGLYWTAGIEIVQNLANPLFKDTFVGIYCSISNNAGGILGNIVGGYIYENFGYFYLWLSCFCFVLFSLSLFLISTRIN